MRLQSIEKLGCFFSKCEAVLHILEQSMKHSFTIDIQKDVSNKLFGILGNLMNENDIQPISNFTKSNQPYKILSFLNLPPSAIAMWEIIEYSMFKQELITSGLLISTFADILGISKRSVITNFKLLEERKFILKRGRKNLIVNSFLANKCEFITGPLKSTIVDPTPCSSWDRKIIEKVNNMRLYNKAKKMPAYLDAHAIQDITVKFIQNDIQDQRIKRLEKHNAEMQKAIDFLIARAKAEDVAMARQKFEVIQGGLDE